MKTIVIVSILAVIFAIAIVGEANAINAKENSPGVQPENAKNLIVGFSDKIPQDIHEKVKAHGAAVVSKNNDINFVVVDPKGRNKAELMSELGGLSRVAYVEEDYIATAFLDPNDPGYPSQWGPRDINAPLAWNITLGSPGVIIAIVDTGVDYNHPDIAANYYAGGYDFINNDADPMDDAGHGTHVAGIAAAVTNNGVGVAGISQSGILAEKVLSASGSGSYSAVANGITHAANKGAKVISMSLGGGFKSTTLQNAVNYAWNKGAILVAAAGNENSGKISYPAAFPNVIAVSALNPDDSFAYYSNHGKKIELAAPGTSVYSTYFGGAYATMSGTSMATPFVSGSAALVLSKNSGLTNQQVRNILDNSAVDLGASGRDVYFGYGKVNPYGALLNTP
jgi:thermitase